MASVRRTMARRKLKTTGYLNWRKKEIRRRRRDGWGASPDRQNVLGGLFRKIVSIIKR